MIKKDKKTNEKGIIISGLENVAKTLGLYPKHASPKKVNNNGFKKRGVVSSFINVMNEGLSNISKNSIEKKR